MQKQRNYHQLTTRYSNLSMFPEFSNKCPRDTKSDQDSEHGQFKLENDPKYGRIRVK